MTAAKYRFDALIPVRGYKRAVNKQTGYGGLDSVQPIVGCCKALFCGCTWER